MPWSETRPMDQRLQFIADAHDEDFANLCRRYGVSRKTGYKWVARYDVGGVASLVDQSRRPHTSPNASDEESVAALLDLRGRHPTCVRWHNHGVNVSHVLAEESIAFDEIADGLWRCAWARSCSAGSMSGSSGSKMPTGTSRARAGAQPPRSQPRKCYPCPQTIPSPISLTVQPIGAGRPRRGGRRHDGAD